MFYSFNAMSTNCKKIQEDICLIYRDSLGPWTNTPDKMYTGKKMRTKLCVPSSYNGLKISMGNQWERGTWIAVPVGFKIFF